MSGKTSGGGGKTSGKTGGGRINSETVGKRAKNGAKKDKNG